MLRLSILSVIIASTSIAACTEQPTVDDELAGESAADGEDGKGDAAAAFTYYNVLPDNRACSLNAGSDCGRGFFVSRANRATTQCGRGAAQSHCKVFTIDWTGTAMPASVAKSYEQRLHDGEPLVIRGALVPAADDRGVSLAATEIWVASSPEWVDGVFTFVKDNGIRCVRAPCPNLTERKLNSNVAAVNISLLDLEASGAEPDAIERASNARYTDGLIVVGYRFQGSLGDKGRTANKFFTRAPVPLH
jgi:hypothetical protein